MPIIKTAHVADQPSAYRGVPAEDVLRLLKGLDSSTRRLLPDTHKKISWGLMTAIQRRKVFAALGSKCS